MRLPNYVVFCLIVGLSIMTLVLTNNSAVNIKMVIDASRQIYPNNRIMADLTAAQAILESGLQNNHPSQLAMNHNNLFGMKPGSIISSGTANPGIVNMPTKEYDKQGRSYVVMQPFLANKSVDDSLHQHAKLLNSLSRYSNLQTAQTFEEAATMIREDGYATDPVYTKLLISIHNQYIKD